VLEKIPPILHKNKILRRKKNVLKDVLTILSPIVKNLTFLMPNLFLSDRWRHPRE